MAASVWETESFLLLSVNPFLSKSINTNSEHQFVFIFFWHVRILSSLQPYIGPRYSSVVSSFIKWGNSPFWPVPDIQICLLMRMFNAHFTHHVLGLDHHAMAGCWSSHLRSPCSKEQEDHMKSSAYTGIRLRSWRRALYVGMWHHPHLWRYGFPLHIVCLLCESWFCEKDTH